MARKLSLVSQRSGFELGVGRPEKYILNATFHSKLVGEMGKQSGLGGK